MKSLIKNKSLNLSFKFFKVLTLSFLPLLAACTPNQTFFGIDRFGNSIPADASGLENYLKFSYDQIAIASTPAVVAMNSINSADADYKFFFVSSFLKLKPHLELPNKFTFDFHASLNPNKANSLIIKLTATPQNGSGNFVKNYVLDGFKPQSADLNKNDYVKIDDNVLKASNLGFLTSENNKSNLSANWSSGDKKAANDAIRFTTNILAKYQENLFPTSPFVNLYYAGNFNAGKINILNPNNKLDQLQINTLEAKAKEIQAINDAKDLLAKKEIQRIIDSNTNEIINPGYSDANKVRVGIQKLIFIATAYKTNQPNNPHYNNLKVKKVLNDVLDDFATNYYCANQQQYVNWWFYEIGIPKDLVKLLMIIRNDFSDNKFNKWLSGLNYFLPNVRYGGGSKTAINGFKPVLKRRLQTGGNLVDNAKAVILSAILLKDINKIEDVILALYDGLLREFVFKDDGFYYDGSFIQHGNLAYVGSYGEVLFVGLSDMFEYFKNTPYDFSKDKRFENLYKFIELSVMPYMYGGSISDSLSGRSIVRKTSEQTRGLNILGALSIFEQNAPKKYKSRLYNFIYNQLVNLSEKSIKKVIKPGIVLDNFLKIKKSSTLEVDYRKNEDWKFYETNYSTNIQEISNLNPNSFDPNKPTVPVGNDNMILNNGLVFSKNQDRYSWVQPNFMINLSLHGRKIGFAEGILGENMEAYYQTDGTIYNYTKNNPDPYSNNYWTTVDPFSLPGTSSIFSATNNDVYLYQYPNIPKNQWNDKQKNDYANFKKSLLDKAHIYEGSVSLKTNSSFNNGIIFENMGMVKAYVLNWNGSLKTRKMYLMIDNLLINMGVVDNNQRVKTNVANAISEANGIENNKLTLKTNLIKINNKNQQFFVINDQIKKDQTGYVILNNKAQTFKRTISKYPIIANNNLAIETNPAIEKDYYEISIDHSKNLKYAYAMVPNYNESNLSKINKILNNFSIISNDNNYIIAKYSKQENNNTINYYFINSFFEQDKKLLTYDENHELLRSDLEYDYLKKEGVYVPGLDLKFHFDQPTSLVVKQVSGFKDLEIVSSGDLNPKSYSIQINKIYNKIISKKITNPLSVAPIINDTPEAIKVNVFKDTYVTVNNTLGLYNNYNHNTWFKLSEYLG